MRVISVCVCLCLDLDGLPWSFAATFHTAECQMIHKICSGKYVWKDENGDRAKMNYHHYLDLSVCRVRFNSWK